MILRLISGLKGKGEGKLWLSMLSLRTSRFSSPSSSSCCCHVGRVWISTNWERAPRGSIPLWHYKPREDHQLAGLQVQDKVICLFPVCPCGFDKKERKNLNDCGNEQCSFAVLLRRSASWFIFTGNQSILAVIGPQVTSML